LPRVTLNDISVILRGGELELEKLKHPHYRRTSWLHLFLLLIFVGLLIFNFGLEFGLAPLGVDTGSVVPVAFMHLDEYKNSPIYGYAGGLTIALAFGFILGFGATLAEPALNVLGMQAEDVSRGKFTKRILLYTVSIGVGAGMMLGLVRIIKHVNFMYFMLPSYSMAGILTLLSSEEYVNIAWDSGAVTTGAVTVPLVMSLGLAFSSALNTIDGFGILALASVMPVIVVLSAGLFVQNKDTIARILCCRAKAPPARLEEQHLLRQS